MSVLHNFQGHGSHTFLKSFFIESKGCHIFSKNTHNFMQQYTVTIQGGQSMIKEKITSNLFFCFLLEWTRRVLTSWKKESVYNIVDLTVLQLLVKKHDNFTTWPTYSHLYSTCTQEICPFILVPWGILPILPLI